MKHIIFVITILVIVSLSACSIEASRLKQATTSSTATVSPVALAVMTTAPTQTIAGDVAEEAEIQDLVENFGKRLQMVSLLAPDSTQEVQKQYSEFVSPALLEMWMKEISKAPGRMVSSPWPDRIEITALSKEGSDRYTISGFVIEVTSTEVVSGGAAGKIPVRIVVHREQDRWFITEYAEER